MIIIQDTREQKPWDFKPHGWKVEVAKLDTGDYSIKGLEDKVSIERKSIHDFVNTMFHAKQRFAKEVDRLRVLPYRIIVVEGDLIDVVQHRYRSRVHPNAVIGMMNYLNIAGGIEVKFWGDPETAALCAQSWMYQIAKKELKEK